MFFWFHLNFSLSHLYWSSASYNFVFFCGIASQLSLCSIWKFRFRSWFNLSRLAFRFLPSLDATNRGRDRRRAPAFRQMQLSAKLYFILVICLNSEQCSWIQIFDSRFFDWGRNRSKVRRQVQDSRGAFCTHVYPCKSHCVTYKQLRHVG